MLPGSRSRCFCFFLLMSVGFHSLAQSITSGTVTGTIIDPAGAAIGHATVTLTNINTNNAQKTTTNPDGTYRFAFVTPGAYRLNVAAAGFQTTEQAGIAVNAGQPTAVNLQLALATASTTVTVIEAPPVLQSENADVSTSYNNESIANLPNPGGDITYIAQTSPGVVMNTQAGYGNFVADGMPATSNLFTVNGTNYNDPFFGINNSGASNLLLGSNDVEEANVINNAYSGQYGQYAGSQIAYITKSGKNSFHGDAIYMWNGRELNSNQFFANQVGLPTPFNNFNQWQTDVNGPIWKNHTFFDVDYEGLRNLIPTAANLNLVPSPQFQAATLANLTAVGHADEIPFYKQAFAIYNNAPGVGAATPAPEGGCQGFTGLPAGVPCALQFRTTPPSTYREYLWSSRVDHIFSQSDRGYIRVLRDNGFQPTFTSPFGPTFNGQSTQPQMNGNISETHTFGPNTVNEFKASVLYYSAIFVPSDPTGALAALPTALNFSGTPFSSIGAFGAPAPNFYLPEGRRVFQQQILDDLSHIAGNHTLRAGFSWLHWIITDLDFSSIGGPIHGAITTSIADFFNGGGAATSLLQAFPSSNEAGLRFNTYGGYVADDWKVSDRLTVSLNLRLENYANPTCDSDCFSRLATTFNGAPNPNAGSTPYNQLIVSGQKNAYQNTKAVVWEPRIGIAWTPFKNGKTVIRTGAGIFADELPGGLAEDAAFNSPGFNAFTIGNGSIAPGASGSLFTTAAAANQGLLSQFKSGGSFNSISGSIPSFSAPNFFNFPSTFHQPTYDKWNFEVQQALGFRTVLRVNYSGMHGSYIPIGDYGLNAYCPPSACPNGFVGLPSAPANAALATVTQYLSAGTSSYNGLTVSLQRRISQGFTFNVNYTWSHALDDVSNGGVANLPFGIMDTDPSVTIPQNPFNIRGNYASSDYDVRHYVSATMMVTDVVRQARMRWGPNRVFGGWTLSSNWFFRTGLPFTVVDTADGGALVGYNLGSPTPGYGTVFATPLTNVPKSCTNAVNAPCLDTSQFAPAGALTGFGTIGRNSIYGPHFFDVDVALMKDVKIGEHVTFSFGAQAYNIFNHPSFDQPVNDISNPQFGRSIAAVGPPTSLLGSFVGAGSSPRFLEIKGIVRF
jgi:Carboxypeptidase regulatory-like domain